MSHACRQYTDLNYVNYNGILNKSQTNMLQTDGNKTKCPTLICLKNWGPLGMREICWWPYLLIFFFFNLQMIFWSYLLRPTPIYCIFGDGRVKWNPQQHKNKQELSKDRWTPQSQQTSIPNYGLNSPINLQLAKRGWVQLHPWTSIRKGFIQQEWEGSRFEEKFWHPHLSDYKNSSLYYAA